MIPHRSRWVFFLILGLLAVSPLLAAPAPAEPEEGVVVEEVTTGWAGEAAGLQPGDVILSWSCPASPPALPQPSSGIVRSPYDLLPVEIEEAPRRAITLRGAHEALELLRLWMRHVATSLEAPLFRCRMPSRLWRLQSPGQPGGGP